MDKTAARKADIEWIDSNEGVALTLSSKEKFNEMILTLVRAIWH